MSVQPGCAIASQINKIKSSKHYSRTHAPSPIFSNTRIYCVDEGSRTKDFDYSI